MHHLKYLNKFFWKYKQILCLGIVFIIVANIFAIYPAEFVREALDYVLKNMKEPKTGNLSNKLLNYGLLIVGCAILKGIFLYFMRQTIIVMSRKIEFDIKNEIFNKYQELSISFYNENKIGDLMNRITEDVTSVRMYIGPTLMYAINIIVLFSLVITKMLAVSKTLTAFVLFPLPILAISIYFVSSKINRQSEQVQAQLSEITSISQETFSGIQIIKSFTNEDNSVKAFFNSCKEYTRKQIKLVKIEAVFIPLIITLIGLSTILTIYVGGLEVFAKRISAGNIAEFIIYVNMLAWPVASIGWVTSLIQRASASQERINEFLNIEPRIVNYNNDKTIINGDLSFKDISLTYRDTKIKALDKISFEVKEGSTLGIFGKTGSGKSTIANIICRILDLDSGNILFGKTPIKKLNLNNLRSSIGYIPQDGYLFSGTIKENIAFSKDLIDENQIILSAKKADILDEINQFPDGFNTIVGERGVQLSGGQRQRLAIARAFYKDPDIYIFDDCLSAVDANKEKEILKNLHNETKNKTTIIISHRISTFQNTDKIIVLKEGILIDSGKHEELISREGFYKEIHLSQSKI
jgi:ATP-binding cassette, subfamily B, multidrug efflux pump